MYTPNIATKRCAIYFGTSQIKSLHLDDQHSKTDRKLNKAEPDHWLC